MNYFIIIDAVTLILGIYIIFVSLRMKKSGKIERDRKSTRLNSSHKHRSRMPSSA